MIKEHSAKSACLNILERLNNMNEVCALENAGTYSGIENRICELEEKCEFSDDLNITGRFFYLTFRGKTITEKEFAKFIYDQIVRYCIPRSKRQKAQRKYAETGEEKHLFDLHDQARDLFVKSLKEQGAQLGEPGELIAFIILEAFFNAPQIACKMFLKTSEKMPVHGSDSVHIKMSDDGERLELIWGEAKMYAKLSDALDKAIGSISEFINGKEDESTTRVPRDRDVDIIKDHPNVDSENMKDALLKYFDPYEKESNNWKEIFMCMVGFDYNLYNKLNRVEEKDVETYFHQNYLERIKSACSLFEDKIRKKGLTELEFVFVLLPFKSLSNFRNEFYKLIGITKKDLGEICDD